MKRFGIRKFWRGRPPKDREDSDGSVIEDGESSSLDEQIRYSGEEEVSDLEFDKERDDDDDEHRDVMEEEIEAHENDGGNSTDNDNSEIEEEDEADDVGDLRKRAVRPLREPSTHRQACIGKHGHASACMRTR